MSTTGTPRCQRLHCPNARDQCRGIYPRPVHLRVAEFLAGELPVAGRRSFQLSGDARSQVSERWFSPISPRVFQRTKPTHSPESAGVHLHQFCDANASFEQRPFRNISVTYSLSVLCFGLLCGHRFCFVQNTSLQRPCPKEIERRGRVLIDRN